jgi:hypothetical protein
MEDGQDAREEAELMAWAETAELKLRPGAVVEAGSPEVWAENEAMLRYYAGPEDAERLDRLTGRPRPAAESPSGSSRELRLRVSLGLDRRLRAQAEKEGRTVSTILRCAIVRYLAERRLS